MPRKTESLTAVRSEDYPVIMSKIARRSYYYYVARNRDAWGSRVRI